MKKRTIIISLLCIALLCNLFCRKEQMALLLPAVQAIRETPSASKWKEEHPGMMRLAVDLSEKLRDEYKQYLSDTNITVTCRVRFTGEKEYKLLPFVETNASDGTSAYFFVAEATRVVFYHVTAGANPAASLPMESLSINYTKIGN